MFTLSALSVSVVGNCADVFPELLRRGVEPSEVGKAGMFLLSDLASGITGENVHVDCGYHVMGAPPLEVQGKK